MASWTTYKKTVSDCVHCGLCKSLCPTYEETLNESYGARGRVILLKELQSGSQALTSQLSDRLFSCLLCGACNSLCPLAIDITLQNYRARQQLRRLNLKARLGGEFIKQVFLRPDLFVFFLYILDSLAKHSKARFISRYLSHFRNLKLDKTKVPLTKKLNVVKANNPKGRIALFPGCTVNYLLPSLALDLAEVLKALQYDMVIPRNVQCCGAPLLSMGLLEDFKRLADRHLSIFNELSVYSVITLCPTCAYTMRHLYKEIAGEGLEVLTDCTEFIHNSWEELSGLCEDLSLTYRGAKIIYHHPCHTKNYLNLKRQAPRVLNHLGLEITEDDQCCGFGGAFSFLYTDMAKDILLKRQKVYGPLDMLVTSCPNCVVQFRSVDINSRHFIELLKIALRQGGTKYAEGPI